MKSITRNIVICSLFIVICQPFCSRLLADTVKGYVPPSGFVPNAETAVVIAEAVLKPVYGNDLIESERPFKAVLKGSAWIVTGSVPCHNPPPGAVCPGGAAEVRISKKTGQILFMTHYQ